MSSDRLFQEIVEQPRALQDLLDQGWERVGAATTAIEEFEPEWALMAGRGTSDNAARYAQYLFGIRNGISVGLAAPSIISLYGARPRMRRALVCGISQSGQSPDIVAVLGEARAQGGMTLAVTNEVDSLLANACQFVVPVHAGRELSVAATKTYTNELLALAMLSAKLEGSSAAIAELNCVPEWAEMAISQFGGIANQLIEMAVVAPKVVVVGRGFNYCTASEIALKIQETCGVMAQSYSAADLLHGSVAMIDAQFLAVLLAPRGVASKDFAQLLTLLHERRSRTVVISDDAALLARGELGLRLPVGIPEWLSPLVSVLPGQLLAHALCLALGRDPNAPVGLSKVTRTL